MPVLVQLLAWELAVAFMGRTPTAATTAAAARPLLLTPPLLRHWMHNLMWWDRLFKQHGQIAWDDYEKDYSDLPEEVLEKHRCAAAAADASCVPRLV